ncbi:MAG: glycosyltransferase, partial [Candidatus Omnitrophota bacterium]
FGYFTNFMDLPPGRKVRKLLRVFGHFFVKAHDRRSMRSARLVMTNSHFTARWIRRVYGVEPFVNYQGVDAEFFRPSSAVERNDHVLSVGRLDETKGHGFVLRALAKVPAPIRPQLVIVCDKFNPRVLEELKKDAERLGVSCDIRHRIDDEALRKLYQSSRLVLCGSVNEPFGLVPLEAMACGTPVIAVKEGGFLETVADGRTGFLLERDEFAWARKIEACLSDPEATEQMGRAGRSDVLERWTWGAFMDRMENVLHSVEEANRSSFGAGADTIRDHPLKKVSVILPSYNYAECLAEAIDSVLSQTYPNWELIIVDDGSSDHSPEIIERCAQDHPNRIRVFFHEGRRNRGLVETYRLGLEKCTGEYTAFIEADDIWLPGNLAAKVEILEKHKEVAVVHSAVEMFGDEDLIRSLNQKYRWKEFLKKKASRRPFFAFRHLMFYNFLLTFSSFVTRREALSGVDFSTKHPAWFDWWLLAQLSLKGSFFYMPQPHVKWRVHPKSYNLNYSGGIDDYREGLFFKEAISRYMKDYLQRERRNLDGVFAARLEEAIRLEEWLRVPRRVLSAAWRAFKRVCYNVKP